MTHNSKATPTPRTRDASGSDDGLARADLVHALKASGYQIFELRRDWAECLLVRGRERWFGRGVDAEDALRAALAEALPSALGWELLLGSRASLRPAPAVSPEPEPEPELEPESEAAVEQPAAALPPEAEPIVEIKPCSPNRDPAPRHAPMSPKQAIEALELERAKVAAQLPEFALWSPQRQRLYLLEAVAGGRALVDAAASTPEVVEHMHGLAVFLSDLAGCFWPGNVSALALDSYPHNCALDLDVRAPYDPRTWLEVAQMAESKLDEVETTDRDRDRDEDGWADVTETLPAKPEARFAQVLSTIRDFSGPLEEKPTHALGGPRNTFAKTRKLKLLATARQLRWLRRAAIDAQDWGRAMGHLRFLAESALEAFPEFRQTVDPRYSPPTTWAQLLGVDPTKRAKQRAWRELLQSFPHRTPDDLAAWLQRATAFCATDHLPLTRLAAALTKNHPRSLDAILSISPDELDGTRADRNRLRKLQATLRGEDPAEAQPEEILREPQTRALQPDHEALRQQLLPLTRGKRALLITNRADPHLEEELKETFEFARLRLVVSSLSKLPSYKQSITRGTVDLVILATGFQSHAMEHAIKPAARAAGIPYISAYRARRLDCMRAMQRDLGLQSVSTG